MPYDYAQVANAYTKLRSYVYFDNSDVLLRRKLVEFESNTTKDLNSIFSEVPEPYDRKKFGEDKSKSDTLQKLEYITNQINNYHKDPTFFDYFINKIAVDFYPKSLKPQEHDSRFVTNRRVHQVYEVDRVNAFINTSIEVHLLSVLWILKSGINLDVSLADNCFGNRLILNQDKENVVKGSGLFKPYFKQYQKWRDDSVKAAKSLLSNNKNSYFLNLDIKNYFHSVRVSSDFLFKPRKKAHGFLQTEDNIDNIFLRIHQRYTELVGKNFETPEPFFKDLEKDSNGRPKQVVLPIGLISSYVLANDYLKKFDRKIIEEVRPAYYGRYVDDLLFVLESPPENYFETLNFAKLIERDFNKVFEFEKNSSSREDNRDIIIKGYPTLRCQNKKTLIYFFDRDESDIVIDKLKKELDEKTSEFRDFPESDEEDEFEESAYHLQYDGSDGKIRTLKDYKEDRYGLTVYLANKIFGALRHEKKISDEEKDQVLKFFKGANCIGFYRLWERIFTFFLVNNHAVAYVEFYIHCIQQIDKIKNVSKEKISNEIGKTLIEYLDASHELSLSLNLDFFKKAERAAKKFKFDVLKINSDFNFFFTKIDPTEPNSFWVQRFRQTNMMRHHYVIHPLLNFTKKSKKKKINLVGPQIDISMFELDEELISNSPRPVKFWECCLATAFQKLKEFQRTASDENDYTPTSMLGYEDENSKFYLDEAFELYKKINLIHIPDYEFEGDLLKKQFYRIAPPIIQNELFKEVLVQEITVDSEFDRRLSKPKISFANTEVEEKNIEEGIRGTPNLKLERYEKLAAIIRKSRKEKADILLFPECFIPVNLLSSLVRYSERNQILTVTGLEHIVQKNTAFNFIVTILPFDVRGKDAVIVFRLKNHYAHLEEELVRGNHKQVPKPKLYRYDIFNWRNIYFSTYYCFELADSFHRSLLRGRIDLLVGVEWNRDTPYFSNIVEAGSRDLHSYVAQVNTSQYGDTRLTQPADTAKKDILRLKGGINDSILVAQINIPALRTFQLQRYALTHHKGEFKPLPPDFPVQSVQNRIDNKNVL